MAPLILLKGDRMKTLAYRLWNEPALASGVLLALAVLLGEVFVGDGLQTTDLPAILAPLGAGGLARQFVSPTETAQVRPPREPGTNAEGG